MPVPTVSDLRAAITANIRSAAGDPDTLTTASDVRNVLLIVADILDGGAATFNWNRAITRGVTGLQGVTPTGSTVTEGLERVFYPAQAPGITASILNATRRLGSSASVAFSWNVTRRTNAVATIVAAGTTQAFDPATELLTPGSTRSGTQATTVNTAVVGSTPYTATVTDASGLTSSVNVSVSVLPERFWAALTQDLLAQEGGEYVLDDAAVSALFNALPAGNKELAAGRFTNDKIITSAGGRLTLMHLEVYAGGVVFVNGVGNTAFGTRTFVYTTPDGFTVNARLTQATNTSSGTFSIHQ